MSQKAYKFRFYPQPDLVILLAKTFGCSRTIYNKVLAYSEKHYLSKFIDGNYKNNNLDNINPNYKSLSNNDRINYVKVLKDLTKVNPENNQIELEFPWLREVSSIALQQSVKHLNNGYDRFFKGLGNKPQFKKKLNKNSFTITGKNSLHFDPKFNQNKKFCIPKYDKPLKIKFTDEFNHLAVSSVTISQESSGRYFISFLVDENIAVIPVNNLSNNTKQKSSIDLGLKTTAKIYNGLDFTDGNLPALLKDIDKKLTKAQRILSRREKGSENRNKQRIVVARLHEKKSNIIQDYYQKLSSKIINENQVIMMENLNINGMKKNRKLSRSIHNVAWRRFINMIEYKSIWHKRELIKVYRFYPSSKICSKCGHVHHGLKLSNRTWTCTNCHATHDRDENACLNLYNYQPKLKDKTLLKPKKKSTAGTAANACGGNVRLKSSKLNLTKKIAASSYETRIPLL